MDTLLHHRCTGPCDSVWNNNSRWYFECLSSRLGPLDGERKMPADSSERELGLLSHCDEHIYGRLLCYTAYGHYMECGAGVSDQVTGDHSHECWVFVSSRVNTLALNWSRTHLVIGRASAASIIRIAWTRYYLSEENALYHIADLSLLTLWETAIGIIGGSASAIKPLFTHERGIKRLIPQSDSTGSTTVVGQSLNNSDSRPTTQDTELSVVKEGQVLTVAQHREGSDDLESLRGVLAAGR